MVDDGDGGLKPEDHFYYTVARFDLLDPPSSPTVNAIIRDTHLGIKFSFIGLGAEYSTFDDKMILVWTLMAWPNVSPYFSFDYLS